MIHDSQHIVNKTLNHLIEKVWDVVAIQNIKRLAPTSAKLQSLQLLHSHIQNSLQNRQKNDGLELGGDPKPISLDTFTVSGAQIVQNKNYGQVDDQKTRKYSIAQISIKNRKASRKYTGQSFFSKKSVSQAKSLIIQGRQDQLFNLPEEKDKHYVYEPNQEKIRQNKICYEQQQVKRKKIAAEKSRLREQQSLKNQRMMKDLKSFTYDYVGGFVKLGNLQPVKDKTIKIGSNRGQQITAKKNMTIHEQHNIPNQKCQERQTKNRLKQKEKLNDKNRPLFYDNRPESLVDTFEDDAQLSEGIKIISKKGNSEAIKQKQPRKLTGIQKYRLQEYKDIIKQKKFKQFTIGGIKKQLNQIDNQVNRTAPLPLKEKQISNKINNTLSEINFQEKKAKSQISIKLQQQKVELPPIATIQSFKNHKKDYLLRKHYKMKQHRRSQSNRTIDISGLSSRVSNLSKDKIIIDNQQDLRFLLQS